jgi:hypothetical protein
MKRRTVIALVALSLAASGRAEEHLDAGAAQQRAQQGQAPAPRTTFSLPPSARMTSRDVGEAQQIAETGAGYGGAQVVAPAPVQAPTPLTTTPSFGIAEAQQRAQAGRGYTSDAAASPAISSRER